MSKLSKLLLGLAALQLALVIAVFASHTGSARSARRWIPDFSPNAVTSISVFARPTDVMKDGVASKAAGDPVVLTKRGNGWFITSAFAYPADLAKVATLLDALADAEASAPLTTDPARHATLQVADDQYDRKITLTMGARTVTLLVGLSTGQTASVRIEGQPDVYESTRITPWTAAGDAKGWMNATYVEHAAINLQAIEVVNQNGTWRFDRATGDWVVLLEGAPVAAPAGSRLDIDLIRQLPNRAATITALAPADPAANVSPDGSPTMTLKIFAANNETPEVYTVFGVGKRYFVHDQARPDAVFVAREQLADLMEVSLAALMVRGS